MIFMEHHNHHWISGISLKKLKQLSMFQVIAMISNIDPCLFVPVGGIQKEKKMTEQ